MQDSTIKLVTTTTFAAVGVALIVLLAAACSSGGEEAADLGDAEAQIEATGAIPIAGEADFEEEDDGSVSAEIAVEGGPPGIHGVHIHEVGDCGDAGMNAGDRLGELGDMTVDAAGIGLLELSSSDWSVGDGGETDLMGRAVIIVSGTDRIACGVIEADPD